MNKVARALAEYRAGKQLGLPFPVGTHKQPGLPFHPSPKPSPLSEAPRVDVAARIERQRIEQLVSTAARMRIGLDAKIGAAAANALWGEAVDAARSERDPAQALVDIMRRFEADAEWNPAFLAQPHAKHWQRGRTAVGRDEARRAFGASAAAGLRAPSAAPSFGAHAPTFPKPPALASFYAPGEEYPGARTKTQKRKPATSKPRAKRLPSGQRVIKLDEKGRINAAGLRTWLARYDLDPPHFKDITTDAAWNKLVRAPPNPEQAVAMGLPANTGELLAEHYVSAALKAQKTNGVPFAKLLELEAVQQARNSAILGEPWAWQRQLHSWQLGLFKRFRDTVVRLDRAKGDREFDQAGRAYAAARAELVSAILAGAQ
jgi:hypothetical protein